MTAGRGAEPIRSRVLRGLAWKGASQVTVQVTRLVVLVLLARLLDPTDYGLAAMVLVFGSFVLVFSDLALGAALDTAADIDGARPIDRLLDWSLCRHRVHGRRDRAIWATRSLLRRAGSAAALCGTVAQLPHHGVGRHADGLAHPGDELPRAGASADGRDAWRSGGGRRRCDGRLWRLGDHRSAARRSRPSPPHLCGGSSIGVRPSRSRSRASGSWGRSVPTFLVSGFCTTPAETSTTCSSVGSWAPRLSARTPLPTVSC